MTLTQSPAGLAEGSSVDETQLVFASGSSLLASDPESLRGT